MPAQSITITAPARLHLGFLDLNGGLGRHFGSIGMAVNEPATVLTISTASQDHATGPEAARAQRALALFKHALGVKTCFDIKITSAIPEHAGLGSGTQLALAVGAGLTAIEDLPEPIAKLGETLSRGARSAIGIGAFQHGGFIIDGGKGPTQEPPPILSRTDFPESWRVLLVLDRAALGVHGAHEHAAFAELPAMPEREVGEICRLTLMQLLPRLMAHDIKDFGTAITRIQELVGAHFASAQGGGIWASQHVATIIQKMGDLGAHGIGQSSWGPTGFAFVESQAAAEKLYQSLNQEAKAKGLEIMIACGRNHGATIERSHVSHADLKTKQHETE